MWETSFYLFGILGMIWVLFWLLFYNDSTPISNKDELPLISPKVSKLLRYVSMINRRSLLV